MKQAEHSYTDPKHAWSKLYSFFRIRVPILIAASLVAVPTVYSIPPGAAELGYTQCVINEVPKKADIDPSLSGTNTAYKWFSGVPWDSTPPSSSYYTDVIESGTAHLVLLKGTDSQQPNICTIPRNYTTGKATQLPLLSAATGFYLEFDVKLSDTNALNFSAVWTNPVEHETNVGIDRYYSDVPGYKRYMELDVDENWKGTASGKMKGTVLYWSGTYNGGYPLYSQTYNYSDPIDRTVRHIFGASWDPLNYKVTWWLDGVKQFSVAYPQSSIPRIVAYQNYYPIICAQTHGTTLPHHAYNMTIYAVRAYAPPTPDETFTELITGETFGLSANNQTRIQGGKIVVGDDDLSVSAIGRYKKSGNTGNHALSLADDSTGEIVTSGTINMADWGNYGDYKYGLMEAPVTLLTGGAYYLLSSETNGGDAWYDGATAVTTTGDATVTSQVYGPDVNNLTVPGNDGQMEGPLNLLYKKITKLCTLQTRGTAVSYTGLRGCKFVVGAANIRVTDLGRYKLTGNSGTHTVKLVNADLTDVTGGSASVSLSSGTAGSFNYAKLSTPVVLLAGETYYLLSTETAGADTVYDGACVVTTTADASVTSQVYGTDNTHLIAGGAANHMSGAVNLKYTLGTW